MDYETSDTLNDDQITSLCDMYQGEWWSVRRRMDDVKKMLKHSDVVLALLDKDTKELIAFARVLTDFVYKALVLDVIVAKRFRGLGLGCALIENIVNHPALKEVRHMELYCHPDMKPFYEEWNFTDDLGPLTLLRMKRQQEPE